MNQPTQLHVRTQLCAGAFSAISCAAKNANCPTMECRNDASPYRINQDYVRCLPSDLLGCLKYPGGGLCETRAECESLCKNNLSGALGNACVGACAAGFS